MSFLIFYWFSSKVILFIAVTGTPQGGSAPTTPVVPTNNSASTPQWQTSAINITENPISEAVMC